MSLRLNRSLLILFSVALAACAPRKKAVPASPPVPVDVARVRQATVPLEITSVGTIDPMAAIQLKPKVQGEILQVHFRDGAQVAAGDLLFTLDPRPFDVALARAQANLAVAQASAANANDQLRRYTSLSGQGAASKEQFAQFKTNADSARATVDARQADVNDARLAREWTEVRAPIAGRAGAALLKVGNIAQSGDVLAVINQIKPIYVSFSVPEAELARVRKWMAGNTLAVIARDAASNQELGRGTLDFIDNTVDSSSGNIVLKGVFPNEQEKLWPGQFVDVALRLTEEKDRLLVPTAAVMDGQNGSQVLVVQGDSASLRAVEIARTFGDDTLITSGLAAGEMIITSGQLRVTPGTRIKPTEKPAPAAPQQETQVLVQP